MKKLSLAIIGGGVAGLTFASNAIRMPNFDIKIFEKQPYLGGRTFSKEVQSNTFADLGANIIDFQSKQQQQTIRQYLKNLLKTKEQDKLITLQQPFLIYQTQLTKGDYQKKRYCYKQGFKSLINDLATQLNSSQFEYNYQVDELHRQNGQWKILNKDKQFYHKAFDYLVFATSGPHALEILSKSQANLQIDLGSIRQQIKKVQYTVQISAAFQLKQAPSFSCILFKNKEVTFMSSHSQKYNKNGKKVVVIQYNHEFSSVHRNKIDQQLQTILTQAIPQQIRSWLGKCIFIKRWSPSLIKSKQKSNIMKFQSLKDKLLVVGDICNGSSRVTGAMETSLKVFNLLNQVYSPKI